MAKTGYPRHRRPRHRRARKSTIPFDGDIANGLPILNGDSNNNNNNSIYSQKKHATSQVLPERVLSELSAQMLEHTKRSGLFDELRMKLMHRIESSEQFEILKNKFKLEVDKFCFEADLAVARSKLREQLNRQSLAETYGQLRELVDEVSRHHRHRLRRLYVDQTGDYLNRLKRKR